jgi:hypothetical protein
MTTLLEAIACVLMLVSLLTMLALWSIVIFA